MKYVKLSNVTFHLNFRVVPTMIWLTSKVVMTLSILLYKEVKKRRMEAEVKG